jgi:Group II intron, maturase-specific domain
VPGWPEHSHGPARPRPDGRPDQFLRGWRQYYRYGNSARSFAKLDRYTTERMALLLSKRHGKHGRGNGMKHVIMSGNRLGLVSLAGTVEYGRSRMLAGEGCR